MPNPPQNNIQNEIEQINKEINLLQEKWKKSESVSNLGNENQKMWVKKGQRMDLSQTNKIQNVVKDILKNKIKQIKKNTNLLQNICTQVKKREIIWKRTEENSKKCRIFHKTN